MAEVRLIPGGGLVKIQDTGEVKLIPGIGLVKDGTAGAPPAGRAAKFNPLSGPLGGPLSGVM